MSKPVKPVVIPALTGIRGYAALIVVVYHCFWLGWATLISGSPTNQDFPIIPSGYLGVDLFFILSGFVLAKTYGPRLVEAHGATIRAFALGRIFRIMPLYLASLLLLAALAPLMADGWLAPGDHSAKTWLLALSLTQGWLGTPTIWNTPGWSLSVEWLAYFAFPVIGIVAMKVERRWIAALLGMLAFLALAAWYLALHKHDFNGVLKFGIGRCLCEFTMGVMLCRMEQLRALSARTGDFCLMAGGLLITPVLFLQGVDLLAPIAFAALVMASASPSRLAQRVFGNRLAYALGEISFSIYLLHWSLLELVHAVATDDVLPVYLALIPLAVIPLAYVAWRWIELPGQAAGKAVARALDPRNADRPLVASRDLQLQASGPGRTP